MSRTLSNHNHVQDSHRVSRNRSRPERRRHGLHHRRCRSEVPTNPRLTTETSYADGTPRVPVPGWANIGLNGPGSLWGNKITRIPALTDIGLHIGWADHDLIETVLAYVTMSPMDRFALRRYDFEQAA